MSPLMADAAYRLRLATIRWTEHEADEVAEKVLAFRKLDPFLSQLAQVVDSRGQSGPHLERFLLKLIERGAVELNLLSKQWVYDALVNVVDRHAPSGSLPDPLVVAKA